jgi:hypothetical protein
MAATKMRASTAMATVFIGVPLIDGRIDYGVDTSVDTARMSARSASPGRLRPVGFASTGRVLHGSSPPRVESCGTSLAS